MPRIAGFLRLKTKWDNDEPDRFCIKWVDSDQKELPLDAAIISFSANDPTQPRTLDELSAMLSAAEPQRHLTWIVRERDGWIIDCDVLRKVKPFRSCDWLRGRMWLRASWRSVRGLSGSQPVYYDAIEFVIPRNADERCSLGIVTSEVFIVHGHDLELLNTVRNELLALGMNPVVLSREISAGDTIIEKLERIGRVGFAVILLTPDDVGSTRQEPHRLRHRARQNVVLELGYFLASLGRRRVCALHLGDLELPSDVSGVVYVPVDDTGSWRATLAAELKAAGIARIETIDVPSDGESGESLRSVEK